MYRLTFLLEYRPEACLDEVNAEFIKGLRRFHRKHPKDLSDRTCYNIMQAVSTFLLQYGIAAAKPYLKQMIIQFLDAERKLLAIGILVRSPCARHLP